MRRLRTLLLLALTLLAATFATSSFAASGFYPIYSSPTAGIQIDAQLPWDQIPYGREGYFPMYIRVTNKSKNDGRWQVSSLCDSGYYQAMVSMHANATLEVPAGETRTFEFLCPLANQYRSNNLRVNFSGTGIKQSTTFTRNSSGYRSDDIEAFGGMSDDLYSKFGLQLTNKINNYGNAIFYVSLTPSIAPEDWRAYQAFDRLYFSQEEWEKLKPSARRAIGDWLMLQGTLHILADPADGLNASLSDLPEGGHLRTLGLGRVIVFDDSVEAISALIASIPDSTTKRFDRHNRLPSDVFGRSKNNFINYAYKPQDSQFIQFAPPPTEQESKLSQKLDKVSGEAMFFENTVQIESVNYSIVILSVIAFGVIVGPVNFFMFARGRNRWRVFITIPAISIIFSLLIVMSIILSDGFGGEGQTSRIVLLDSARKTRINLQDELSVTGILMNDTFEIPDTGTYIHIGSKLPNSTLDRDGNFAMQSNRYSGDYYQSRRLQWNRLMNVTPSREAVLVKTGKGEATISSNLQANCRELYYIDDDGDFWLVHDLGVGRSAQAAPSTKEAFRKWWLERANQGGASELFAPNRRIAARKGWFYARAEPVQDSYPETLKNIDWQNHQTLIAGPIVKEGGN
ncbi:hypothetical protein [Cerasicoccus maritimus]|uniref:hypothetical protein n=1 Tax=Cerasicoccus maritimus TaxID=490089 RepID=UPI0028529BAD|nr:hypothetical protein [Cerasicoccus maritimus]